MLDCCPDVALLDLCADDAVAVGADSTHVPGAGSWRIGGFQVEGPVGAGGKLELIQVDGRLGRHVMGSQQYCQP
jgi:hypothetical protein